VCLCHIGDIVFSLVFEYLCVLVVVRVDMRLVKEFYSCVVLLWSSVLLIKHCFFQRFAQLALVNIEFHFRIIISLLLDSVFVALYTGCVLFVNPW
jgi:hypothetical protein